MTTPATLELSILWERLISVVEQASATIRRCAFSSVVREGNDFACLLFDVHGNSIAQSRTFAVPSFTGTMPRTMKELLGRIPLDRWRRGDVIITNDPWLGTGHLPDVCTFQPIFRGTELIAFAGSVAHSPDIGGRGRTALAREVFEEGLRLPPCLLYREGKLDLNIVGIIRSNVRIPDQLMGDIEAQIAANRILSDGLLEVLESSRLDRPEAFSSQIRQRTEELMRRAIAEVPDGSYRFAMTIDGVDERVLLQVEVGVAGATMTVDFAGSSSQVPYAINVPFNYTISMTNYALKCVLAPDVPNNEGSFVPVRVSAPSGSVLNPEFPAAVGSRTIVGHFIPGLVLGALAEVLPRRVLAPGGGPNWAILASGRRKEGSTFASVAFVNAGQGASEHGPGMSSVNWPSNASSTPTEILEHELPILVEERSIRHASGGSGRNAGGDGQRFRFRATGPLRLSFLADRTHCPAPGLFGGGSGQNGRVVLNGDAVDAKASFTLKVGDQLTMETPGGGAYGELPTSRSSQRQTPSRRSKRHQVTESVEVHHVR